MKFCVHILLYLKHIQAKFHNNPSNFTAKIINSFTKTASQAILVQQFVPLRTYFQPTNNMVDL